MKRLISAFVFVLLLASTAYSQSQPAPGGPLLEDGTLHNCVQYALAHHPLIQRSLLDEEITERTIQSKLADWFPQLKFNFIVQHNPQLPTSIVQGNPVKLGLANTSSGQFSVTQTLFDKDVLLASASASDARTYAKEKTSSTRIDVVTNVSKAYYAVLVTQEQISLLAEDIVRLEQSLKDATNQYRGGIVDKTDYMRATIALNNAKAQMRQYEELLNARSVALKEQMGYPSDRELKLQFDSTQMEREVLMDTTQTLAYERRIEYQSIQTQKRLQEDNLDYYKWSFLPSLSAFGNYNMNYQNNLSTRLYNQDYPSSSVGLQLSFPIFEGGKRIQEIRQAKLELDRFDEDILSLKNSIATEFAQAIANYRSNLNYYHVLQDNLDLAREVYEVVQLQYKAGTKTYLEVITAESDLRTAQVNHADALYQVLSSKLDVQKALGTVQF